MSAATYTPPGLPFTGAPFPLSEVISTHELASRPARAPDPTAETAALIDLAETMAATPAALLQKLVDHARALCDAHSSGISLLDPDLLPGEAPHFRWVATSGGLGPFLGQTMPRNFSPCGAVLDANCMLLMREPVRHYEYISGLPVPVHEVLLMPFYRDGIAIGTVWVATHDLQRRFDREDARVLEGLAKFAAAAVQVLGMADAKAQSEATARHHAEKELAALQELHRVAAQATDDKATFLATITHELRNVLAPLSNAAQIIKLSPDRNTREHARVLIERQIASMDRLVGDLLDTSRISTGKLRLDLGEVCLGSIVREAAEAGRSRIEQSGQALIMGECMQPLLVRGDRVRLAQVMANLLSNAAKYGRIGERVFVEARRDGMHAMVRVRDGGVGLDAEARARVFDFFYQVDGSIEKAQGGLGIGLGLVKRLVEMHDGSIEVHSDGLGRGSEFVFRLPVAG